MISKKFAPDLCQEKCKMDDKNQPDGNPEDYHPDPKDFTISEFYNGGLNYLTPKELAGLLRFFNDDADNLPAPILKVRIESLPHNDEIEYLLFGKVYPEGIETQFGTIHTSTTEYKLYLNITQSWAREYFENLHPKLVEIASDNTRGVRDQIRAGFEEIRADLAPDSREEKIADVVIPIQEGPSVKDRELIDLLKSGVDQTIVRKQWYASDRAKILVDPRGRWKYIKKIARKELERQRRGET